MAVNHNAYVGPLIVLLCNCNVSVSIHTIQSSPREGAGNVNTILYVIGKENSAQSNVLHPPDRFPMML